MIYDFKSIPLVPNGISLVDIVLARTQRKTPSAIHRHYEIGRIRKFYIRKVKFTQMTIHEKLSKIIEEFPRLDDIHPFYADLMNVLYDRDHYKLALGQISTARHLVDKLGQDYVRLLKYGDSLYRCKQLKRAALGRMCTILKKQTASLEYLEQVRQHLSRLPSIDPNARTLILCGYPNVGKSSFMNQITRADVDVQPYPFTTKSLFVGHTDYKYLQWQVIDTPGILDKPLEDRNTIEMQSVTALAHLRAAVLYFIDISEQCGYSLDDQIALFTSLRPLFVKKPIVLICSKTDLRGMNELSEAYKEQIQSLVDENTRLLGLSALTGDGVSETKNSACEMLLEVRVESKLRARGSENILSRLHLAMPVKRDDKIRAPTIPQSVLDKRSGMDVEGRETEQDLESKNGGPGRYVVDLKKHYDLSNEEWKYDAVPEIVDGKNIMDFVDRDILAKLDDLEREEEALENEVEVDIEGSTIIDEGTQERIQQLRDRKKVIKEENRLKRVRNSSVLTGKQKERSRSKSRARLAGKKRGRSVPIEDEDVKRPRTRSMSTVREDGFQGPQQKEFAVKLAKKAQKKISKDSRKGEADRHVYDLKPKHLFTGKRKSGTHNRR